MRAVCGTDFDATDAGTVCTSLGYLRESAFVVPMDALAVPGNAVPEVAFWLDGVDCKGNESNIGLCDSRGWGVHSCDHRDAVGVECYAGLSVNCSTDTVEYARMTELAFDECVDFASTPEAHCVCAADWYWAAALYEGSYIHSQCANDAASPFARALTAAAGEVARAEAEDPGCRIARTPSATFAASADVAEAAIAFEESTASTIQLFLRARFTSLASHACDVIRHHYSMLEGSWLNVSETEVFARNEKPPILTAALAVLRAEAEQWHCGKLLFCPAGHHAHEERVSGETVTTCVRCPAGTYAPRPGSLAAADCNGCPPGTYSNATGAVTASTCSSCPAGTYAPGRAERCVPCPRGSYIAHAGHFVYDCALCPPGSVRRAGMRLSPANALHSRRTHSLPAPTEPPG